MAGELQGSYIPSQTCYFLMRDTNANIANNVTETFVSYSTGAYSGYVIQASEQGGADTTGFYVGNIPTWVAPGAYGAVMKQQVGSTPAQSDPTIDVGNLQWNGSAIVALSSLASSGQIAEISPIKIARGNMIQNFEIYLVSSVDHVTPFTSGIVSGQINRDGQLLSGTNYFGPLQSGSFNEIGLGFYTVSLTSGDLNCNTAALVFSANGVSGGSSDPRAFSFVMQRVSGST